MELEYQGKQASPPRRTVRVPEAAVRALDPVRLLEPDPLRVLHRRARCPHEGVDQRHPPGRRVERRDGRHRRRRKRATPLRGEDDRCDASEDDKRHGRERGAPLHTASATRPRGEMPHVDVHLVGRKPRGRSVRCHAVGAESGIGGGTPDLGRSSVASIRPPATVSSCVPRAGPLSLERGNPLCRWFGAWEHDSLRRRPRVARDSRPVPASQPPSPASPPRAARRAGQFRPDDTRRAPLAHAVEARE